MKDVLTPLAAAASMALAALALASGCGRTLDPCEGAGAGAAEGCVRTSPCEGTGAEAPSECDPAPRPMVALPAIRGVGAEGARQVAAALDREGRAVVAWTAVIDGSTRVLVGEEETRGGAFAIREPASRLPGESVQPTVAAGPGRRATVGFKQVLGPEEGAVFVSERDESGAWNDPTELGDAFSFPPRGYEPRALTTPLGEVIVVWNQWYESSYGPQIATRREGEAWKRPSAANEVLAAPYLYSNAPTPAASRSGDVIVTWYQAARNANLMAFASERAGADGAFSRSTGQDFLSPRDGSVGGSGTGSPRPAFGPDGEAACVWTQLDDQERLLPYLATRSPAGVWSPPSSLDDSSGERRGRVDGIALAFGANGTLHVVWTHDTGDGLELRSLRRSKDGAFVDDVRAPPRISTPGLVVLSPVLAAGADGTLVVAWVELERGGSALRMRRARDGAHGDAGGADGGWGPIETLAEPERKADGPALAIGGSPERIFLAWTEGTPKGRVYAASID